MGKVISDLHFEDGETPFDAGPLKISVSTRAEINRYEFENVLKATSKYLAKKPSERVAPFTYEWALKLHEEMFGDVWKWAGCRRTIPIKVKGRSNVGDPPHLIDQKLHDLLLCLEEWQKNKSPMLQQAGWLHHRAVLLHPFLGGNGRWARLLANVWLRKNGYDWIAWPEETISDLASAVRARYLDALRAADEGDEESLMNLLKKYSRDPELKYDPEYLNLAGVYRKHVAVEIKKAVNARDGSVTCWLDINDKRYHGKSEIEAWYIFFRDNSSEYDKAKQWLAELRKDGSD